MDFVIDMEYGPYSTVTVGLAVKSVALLQPVPRRDVGLSLAQENYLSVAQISI